MSYGPAPLLAIAAVVLVGFAAGVVLLVSDPGTLASNEVSLSDLEDSPYGVEYLEDHNVFVVASEDGPIALGGDAQHLPDDPVWYCPLSDWFEGPYHGARFDRLGRYANGPPRSDMDRVVVEVSAGTVVVEIGTVVAWSGRGPVADPPRAPTVVGFRNNPGSSRQRQSARPVPHVYRYVPFSEVLTRVGFVISTPGKESHASSSRTR